MNEPRWGSRFERLTAIASRRGGLALLATGAALSVTLAVCVGLPDVYRATAAVLVEPPQGLEPPAPGEIEARLHLITQKIVSRASLEELVRGHRLYAELCGKASIEEVLARLRDEIRIELKGADGPGGGRAATTAFAISYVGRDPETVADVANTLASRFIEEDVTLRSGAADSLAAQVERVRQRLEQQERRLRAFHERHAGELPQELESNRAALQQVEAQLRLAGESRMRTLERRGALLRQLAEDPGVAGDPDTTAARLAKLGRELLELQRRYTDKHPDIVRLKAESAALERQPSEAKSTPPTVAVRPFTAAKEALTEVNAELASLKREEEGLQRAADAYRRRIEAAPGRGLEYAEMTRDYETTRALYNGLLRRYEEAQLAAGPQPARSSQRLRLLEAAQRPSRPVAPNRPRLLAAGLMLALGLGVGLVILLESTDVTFHSVDDLRGFTRVPVLASIPRIQGRWAFLRWLRKGFVTLGAALSLAVLGQLAHWLAQHNDALIGILTRVR